jgi:hypothetical protein
MGAGHPFAARGSHLAPMSSLFHAHCWWYRVMSGDIIRGMARAMSLRFPDELWERMERARGDVPRERWVRQKVVDALGGGPVAEGAASRPVRVDTPEDARSWALERQARLNRGRGL